MTLACLRAGLRASWKRIAETADFSVDVPYETDETLRLLGGFDRAYLLLHGDEEAPADLCDRCFDAARKRAAGEPLAYLLGAVSFFGHDLLVRPGCLIPRADTEVLVEEALGRLPENGVLWDLCTGSGCVPCAVLSGRQDVRAWGVELYPDAEAVCLLNRERFGLGGRFSVCRGDVLAGACPDGAPSPDVITANPPYIPTAVCKTLDTQVKREPLSALDGGEDGLLFYRAILGNYADVLSPDGCFLFEIGYDEGDALRALAAEHGFSCDIRRDYAGLERTAILCRTSRAISCGAE